MSIFRRPKVCQIFVIHYSYLWIVPCMPGVISHWGTERTAHWIGIVHWAMLHKMVQMVKKCVKVTMISDPSKNCPRKYRLTDRSLNRTLSFSDSKIFIPLMWTVLHFLDAFHNILGCDILSKFSRINMCRCIWSKHHQHLFWQMWRKQSEMNFKGLFLAHSLHSCSRFWCYLLASSK